MSISEKVVERVCAVVVRTLDLPPHLLPLGIDTGLYGNGLGGDSLDALRLIVALEEEFDLVIDDEELGPATFERVGSLVCLVHRVKRGS